MLNAGALDPTFGTGGIVFKDYGHVTLARYHANGTLDTTFGSGGKVTTAVLPQNDGAVAVTLQEDGRILAGGWANRGFVLARYLGDPPAIPLNLTATTISASEIHLAWTAASTSVTGYIIERSTDGINFSQVASVAPTVTSYLDTLPSPSTRYYYRLRVDNANGFSAFSPLVTADTLPS